MQSAAFGSKRDTRKVMEKCELTTKQDKEKLKLMLHLIPVELESNVCLAVLGVSISCVSLVSKIKVKWYTTGSSI